MAKIWTPERNERLLLLIVQDFKVDSKKLVDAWKKQYGSVDNFEPTPRAISEQFGVLKKKAGVKGDGSGKVANGTSTPRTPRTTTKAAPNKSAKAAASATPFKRKRSDMSDDEEPGPDDDDSEIDVKNLPPALSRTSLARTMKVPKRYEEPDSEDEKPDDESDAAVPVKDKVKDTAPAARDRHVSPVSGVDGGDEFYLATPKPKTNGARLDSVTSDLVAEGIPAGKKTNLKKVAEKAFDDDSDVSDFAKSFG